MDLKRGAGAIALLLILGAAVRTGAQQPDQRPTVETYGEAGARRYKLGEFEEAIAAFKQAYLLQPIPLFLYNIAQAHRRLGQIDAAIAMYERFMKEGADPEVKARARRYVDTLRAQRARERERRREEARRAEARRAARQRATGAAAVETAPGALGKLERAAPARRPIHRRWWFWTAVGGGVAAAAVIGLSVGLSRGEPGEMSGSPPPEFPPGTVIYEPMF